METHKKRKQRSMDMSIIFHGYSSAISFFPYIVLGPGATSFRHMFHEAIFHTTFPSVFIAIDKANPYNIQV